MLKLLETVLRGKIATEKIDITGPKRMRGKILWDGSMEGMEACCTACPVGALTVSDSQPYIDYHKCIFCGRCVSAALDRSLVHSNKDVLPEILSATQTIIEAKIKTKLGRSLHVRHLDAGSCNACDFEMGALSNPVYDLHRFGISFVASPRHADLLMVTGVVTRNLEQALRMSYAAMPEPRLVMACGACAAGGATYTSNYAVVGKVSDVIPVDIVVPGCPPRPSAMIIALCAAADILKERQQ